MVMNRMKNTLFVLFGAVALCVAGSLLGRDIYRSMWRPSSVVILSTNDIHASLGNFARLATAVERCRDTVFTILVDAGDRWTGNAYVDLAEDRKPIIDLMNSINYDVATFGNHEFDCGAGLLGRAVAQAEFNVVCANMTSHTEALPTPAKGTTIASPEGVRFDFVGVVTNYNNGHPDGDEASFEGLSFEDPQQAAVRQARAMRGDVRVLLSHMGDDKDMELAARTPIFNLIIGGHTHRQLDTLVGRTTIGQTGRKLKNVGVTRISFKGCRVASIEYENLPLADYEEDAEVKEHIAQIEKNPILKRKAGTLATTLDHTGLAHLQTMVVAEATGADVGLYHYGGVRLESLESGVVTIKDLFDNEPFFTQVVTATMSAEQLRRMIVAKYNDTKNPKEAHRIDIFATTPYDIIVDGADCALDVRFHALKEGVKYKVAMPDYMAENYPAIECDDMTRTPLKVYDLGLDYFARHSPVSVSNTPLQRVVKQK